MIEMANEFDYRNNGTVSIRECFEEWYLEVAKKFEDNGPIKELMFISYKYGFTEGHGYKDGTVIVD